MPQYFSPGVYVEEVDAGPKPIEGVSTSVAGAVGVTERGPTSGKPVLVTSFPEFQRIFGGFLPEPEAQITQRWGDPKEGGQWWKFPLSVKGFFDNGGQQLFVKRVFATDPDPAKGAQASKTKLGAGLVFPVAQDADVGDTEVQVSHLFGVAIGDTLHVVVNGVDQGSVDVASYDASRGVIVLVVPLTVELREERDFLSFADAATRTGKTTGGLTAKASGVWGDEVRARVLPMVSATVELLADPATGGAPFSTTLSSDVPAGGSNLLVADASGLANGNKVEIQGNIFVVSNVNFELAADAALGDTDITLDRAGPQVGDQLNIQGTSHVVTAAAGVAITVDPALAADAPTRTPVVPEAATYTVATVPANPNEVEIDRAGLAAATTRPSCCGFAPENAPLTCPKSSFSNRSGEIDPQLTATNGCFARLLCSVAVLVNESSVEILADSLRTDDQKFSVHRRDNRQSLEEFAVASTTPNEVRGIAFHQRMPRNLDVVRRSDRSIGSKSR